MMKTSLGKLVVVLLLLLVSSTCYAQQTLTVPDDYPTIQAAIDAAQPGDTVYVRAGRYTENLVIDKPLHLLGEDCIKVIIQALASEQGVITIQLEEGKVLIEGVKVAGGTSGIRVEVASAAQVKIQTVIVAENRFGITSFGRGGLTVANSFLIGNKSVGLRLENSSSHIRENEVSGGGFRGILLVGRTDAELLENLIVGCLCGIVIDRVTQFTGKVVGQKNRIDGFLVDLLSDYSNDPWPEGFLDLGGTKTIKRAEELFARGLILYDSQDFQGALTAYRVGLTVLAEAPSLILQARFCQRIGVVYNDLGRYEAALAAYKSAREVYASRRMDVEVALIDRNIGEVYQHVGHYEKALEHYKQVREVYAARRMELALGMVDVKIGTVYHKLGLYEEALEYLKQAWQVLADYARHWGKDPKSFTITPSGLWRSISVACYHLGRYEEALRYSRWGGSGGYTLFGGADVEAAIDAVSIGIIYHELDRYEEALAICGQALEFLDGILAPNVRWQALFCKGLSHEALGQREEARASYEEAIAVIESIRGGFTSEELKLAWQEQTQYVYERLIDLLYRMGEGVSAFTYAERCRARTFLDALYQGSIAPNQLISPEAGISSGAVDPVAIDQAVADARDSLRGNEAVLEYMVTDTGVYLWVITKETISDPIFIKYAREKLMTDVITLRQSLESTNTAQITRTQLLKKFLTLFYDKLVKESLAKLPEGVDTLILIPSGPLWYLPFSALVMTDQELPTGSGTTRHPYLVEKFTLAYLPSLASLSSLATAETQSPSTPFMALANPTLSAEQIKELGTTKYQYAQLEDAAEAIRQRLAGQEEDVYVEGQAREPQAYQEIPVHTVEFYGCHGAFNPKVPLQSKLFLAPGERGESTPDDQRNPDGNYHAWEALLTDHRGTELVILGACESLLPAFYNMQNTLGTLSSQTSSEVILTEQQLKQIVVGDEVVGLARAFLSSGAEAVLGTLWQANPGAIKELLVSMCEYHNQSYTWVQALTKAQRELITNDVFKSPWLWAPYQLIGRWR